MKDDLISRQAAIKVIDAVFPVDPMKSEYAQGIACGAALAKTYVEQLPSAQPEMIRCKECIYFDKYIDCKEMYQWDGFCADWARNTYENWYCSRAERRNDG